VKQAHNRDHRYGDQDECSEAKKLSEPARMIREIRDGCITAVADLENLVTQSAREYAFDPDSHEDLVREVTNLLVDVIWEGALEEPAELSDFVTTVVRLKFLARVRSKIAQIPRGAETSSLKYLN
jgi:hypothetical protein